MDRQIKMKTLVKCLLFFYVITLVFIIHKLHDESFEQVKQLTDMELKKLENRSITVRNVTELKYVYRNITKFVFVNNTIEQVIYKDKVNIQRYGPGENGTKVIARQPNEKAMSQEEMEKKKHKKFHGFDTLMSDTVSLHRKLPDMRQPACLTINYPDNMPPVSVVIIFRDEWHSILLRTAYSVLEMSPPELLKEIVLVDDGSSNPELVAKVDMHVANVDKFKLVRNNVSLGLMMARQAGIDATTADYFIVMDGHMEVGPGWLEPLIYRLTQEPNALLCSHVGVIRHENFEYFIDDEHYGLFDAQFPFFDPLTLDQLWGWFSNEFRTARNKSIEPLPYGTIQGMMAVMRKDFFYQLGGFDPGMKVWGSEQMELSFKVWMCGGRVEMIPCSKVAHMFRQTPWGGFNKTFNFHATNKARTIDVWMDPPYRDYINEYIKNNNYTKGDLSDRFRIRKENQCKSYQFFIDTVKQFSDVYVAENPREKGAIYNKFYKKCLDNAKINETHKLILYPCHGMFNQYFLLTEYSEIRTTQGNVVQAVQLENSTSTRIEIITSSSIVRRGEAKWSFKIDGSIFHIETELCLKATRENEVALVECTGASAEIWEWGYVVKK